VDDATIVGAATQHARRRSVVVLQQGPSALLRNAAVEASPVRKTPERKGRMGKP
jgi:hypothetical protein